MNSNQGSVRIVGNTGRMGAAPTILPWQPLSRDEIEALPARKGRAVRGWQERPAEDDSTVELGSARDGDLTRDHNLESNASGARLPDGIQPESPQAHIYEHSREAAAVLSTILGESSVSVGNRELPAPHAVALFTIGIGPAVAGRVLKHLTDPQLEEIALALTDLQGISHQTTVQVMTLVQERMTGGDYVELLDYDLARDILRHARGVEHARYLMERAHKRKGPTDFSVLKKVSPEQIGPFLGNEHPQTIALILTQVDPPRSAAMLSTLSTRLQADVAYRLSTMDHVAPHWLRSLENSLEASLRDILGGEKEVGGPRMMAEVLTHTQADVKENILGQFEQDPEVLERVKASVSETASRLRGGENGTEKDS